MPADVGEVKQQRRYDEGRPACDEVGNGPVAEPARVPSLRDAPREVRVAVGAHHPPRKPKTIACHMRANSFGLLSGGRPLERRQQDRVSKMLRESIVQRLAGHEQPVVLA
jgi:hypothetical protein